MSRKICLLRISAEIESLSQLQKLQEAIRARLITEAEASIEFKPYVDNLPKCEHHLHLTKREAKKLERQGALRFLLGFDGNYAQEDTPVSAGIGRKFEPSLVFSAGLSIGRWEMYS